MEENKTIEQAGTISAEEAKKQIEDRLSEIRAKNQEANEALSEGKGILKLETPISTGDDGEITELPFDFTALTGLEYVEAMDSDSASTQQQTYRITYRQALALFARASARYVDMLDARDIVERIGMTDAVEGVRIATLFFNASMRAGHLRISKK